MLIFAIDPGSKKSGWALYDSIPQTVVASGTSPNNDVVSMIEEDAMFEHAECYIEDMTSYGKPVGQEVFDTLKFIGRIAEVWCRQMKRDAVLVTRKAVKRQLCRVLTASDTDVVEAIKFRLGDPGTRANPGKTFGVTSHAWQALGLAIYAGDTHEARRRGAA